MRQKGGSMRAALVVAMCVVLALGLAMVAQAMPAMGKADATLAIGFQRTSNAETIDLWNIAGDYGKYINENVQVGLGGQFWKVKAEVDGSGGDSTIYALLARAKYNFVPAEGGSNNTVPYVGVQLGWAHASMDFTGAGSESDSSSAYGAMAGMKLYQKADRYWFAEFNWVRTKLFDEDQNNYIVWVGPAFEF